MQASEFQDLKYGNVVADETGDQFIVLHVNRDTAGKAVHVALVPAISLESASCYRVVSKTSSETFLAGRSVPHP